MDYDRARRGDSRGRGTQRRDQGKRRQSRSWSGDRRRGHGADKTARTQGPADKHNRDQPGCRAKAPGAPPRRQDDLPATTFLPQFPDLAAFAAQLAPFLQQQAQHQQQPQRASATDRPQDSASHRKSSLDEGSASHRKSTLDEALQILEHLLAEDMRNLVFGDHMVSLKLREMAYDCPPHLSPDTLDTSDSFIQDRKACNSEMMRRCKALCTAKTRQAIRDNSQDYSPYIMKAAARRDLQKIIPFVPLDADTFSYNVFLTRLEKKSPYEMKGRGALPEMITQVAATIADDGQANLEAGPAASEASLLRGEALQALTSASGAKANLVRCTLEDLQHFQFSKLHNSSSLRSLEWALEETKIEKGMDKYAETRDKSLNYQAAMNDLIKKKGSGKGGKTSATSAIKEFKRLCGELGVKFNEVKLKDVSQLLGAVKARLDFAVS